MLDAGFDYVELGAGALFDEPKLYEGLPLEATNLFFKPGIVLFGDQKTPYLGYAERVVHAAANLGARVMVIGSGNARMAPEGYDVEEANQEFADKVASIAEIARPLGVMIAPESLNRTETNVANDLGQLAEAMVARRLGYTADVYHVLQEWKQPDRPTGEYWKEQVPYRPSHVHFADLPRYVPAPDDPDVLAFLKRLVELGYDDRISFEGNRQENRPKQVLERMQTMWKAVN